MYYHRRPPERSAARYGMPFFVLLTLGVLLFFGWRFFDSLFLTGQENTGEERVFLNIEEGTVKAMAADSTDWKNVPDQIYLYRGEKLKTGVDGRASLAFFDQSVIRMDQESEIHFKTLKRKNETGEINVELPQGNFWITVEPSADPDSRFSLETPLLQVETRQGTLALESPGTVTMMEGTSQIGVKKEGEVIRTYMLGIGQQLILDETTLTKIAQEADPEVIFAISDAFKNSAWTLWNQQKEDRVLAGTQKPEETLENKTETPSSIVSKDTPRVSAGISAPQITAPGKTGETVTLADIKSTLEGTAGPDTETIIVNDYPLQLYVAGNSTFRYVAHTAYGNLKVGSNEFKIYAKNKSGTLSDPALITLILPQEVYDAHADEISKTPAGSSSAASSSGGVRITEPNQGESFTTTETEFDLKGTVPANTAKVVVNDYALTRFSAGDTAWTYKAYSSLGSLEIGKKNTYTVEAFDASNALLGSASITIDVESGGNPEITIPTTRSSYLTTLNEIVIGGTVGKWVQAVYVNDKKLLNYIPGNAKWHHTVTLTPGKNTFSVFGQKDGVNTGADEIEILYQP